TPPAPGGGKGVRFELNQGQSDGRVAFVVRGAGYPLYVGAADLTAVLASAPQDATGDNSTPPATPATGREQARKVVNGAVLRLHLAGGDAHARVTGEGRLPGVTNYLTGHDPSRWRTNVPSFAAVRVHDVYPGVDVVYHAAAGGGVEYDYEVAAGASSDAIA